MSMKTMLVEEIEHELKVVRGLNPGEENHKIAVNSLVSLMDRAIEFEKIEADAKEKEVTRVIEADVRLKQEQEDKKDRLIRYVMTGSKDVAIIVVAIWGTVASMNFEREGTITTSAGRKHLNKILSLFK